MGRKLNKKEFAAYSKYNECPCCKSGYGVEFDDMVEQGHDDTVEHLACCSCGARWEEQYILHKVIVNKEGDTDEGS